jgi:ribosomal protein S18 acetylase RimI-like enzyme
VNQRAVRRRAVEAADGAAVLAIFASTREEELAAVPWSPEEREAFLRAQSEAQERHYRTVYPEGSFELLLVDETPIGRLYLNRGVEAVHVIDLALLPEYRGLGIGSALLEELIAEAESQGKSVSLHVERLSPARGLYQRLGFSEVEDRGIYLLLERPPQLKTA